MTMNINNVALPRHPVMAPTALISHKTTRCPWGISWNVEDPLDETLLAAAILITPALDHEQPLLKVRGNNAA